MQILVVEDEAKLAHILNRSLAESSYSVDIARDGEEALYKVSIQAYDLIILDILLPKLDGIAVCESIREDNNHTPILMLTALDAHSDRIRGLDRGADDYLAKPFNLEELHARVRALLRRSNKSDPVRLQIDTLVLDPATKSAFRDQTAINLTTKEYALLEYFMRNQGRVIGQSELLDHVWDYAYDGLSNVVETYVRYVRKKIAPNNELPLIHTKRGSGYIMVTTNANNV